MRGTLSTNTQPMPVEADRTTLKMSMSLELPRECASVPLVRHFAARSLSELGVVDEVVDDLEIALSEVCTNVIGHAKTGDSYEVEVFVKGHYCKIRVIDSGLGFDPVAVAEKGPETDFEHGRGLAIVRAVMDRVDLESHTDRGTLVTLEKRLEFRFELEGS